MKQIISALIELSPTKKPKFNVGDKVYLGILETEDYKPDPETNQKSYVGYIKYFNINPGIVYDRYISGNTWSYGIRWYKLPDVVFRQAKSEFVYDKMLLLDSKGVSMRLPEELISAKRLEYIPKDIKHKLESIPLSIRRRTTLSRRFLTDYIN